MYCGNCGNKLPDGACFCTRCGAPVGTGTPGGNGAPNGHRVPVSNGMPVTGGLPPKKKRVKAAMIVIPATVLVVFILGAVVCMFLELDHRKDDMASAIQESGIPGCIARVEAVDEYWSRLGVTDISEKKALLGELESIAQEVEDFEDQVEEVEQLQDEKEKYRLEENAYETYEGALEKCAQAVKEKDPEDLGGALEDAKGSLEDLVQANDARISDVVSMYEDADLTEAAKSEIAAYDENMAEIKDLVAAEDRDYRAISQAFSGMDETIYMYMEPETPLDVSVQQVDVLDFPKVRLYLNVKDPASGEVPGDLEDGLFYVRKEDANAKYVKQTVTAVNQLNENEVLKVDMVADVSGSMDGDPLDDAKDGMCNFINSVQFAAGDMVELTSFSTGVRLEQEFCSDADLLIRKINALYTQDMTSLYDALYTAVERVAAQSGARCVIAFTDGNDNYSNCSKDDVVLAAQRYHVPVFIIGIGDVDYSEASSIAQQTGGMYYNVDDVYSMGSIYDEIYRMEKELYLVEFEDNTGAKATDVSNIETGYRSREYGGECRYSYTPNVLLDADGDAFYKDGPEAVVERYMRGFADAVTESDFSYIEDCLRPGSSIYSEQQKYIQRDIREQVDSFEIVSVDHKSSNSCVVRTRETYYVQVENDPLQLMTQECQYAVEDDGSGWQMTAFVGSVNVISRIRQ